MTSYPVEIARCRHIKTSGVQCGSPALREKEFCYYHQNYRPGGMNPGGDEKQAPLALPVLEDAYSIQFAIGQVMQRLLDKSIDAKTAGLLLYGLQIASSNLKQMEAEKPRPAQVVVDVERVGETPMGMTPWSEKEGGHEPEEVEDKVVARTKRAILEEEENARRARENRRMKQQLEEITQKMEHGVEEMEKRMTKKETTGIELQWGLEMAKESMRHVAEANRHGLTLDEWYCDMLIEARNEGGSGDGRQAEV